MQSGNPNNQDDDPYGQPIQYQNQQYPYQQPQQYTPPPIMPPPKRPWYKRTWKWYRTRSRRTQIILAAVLIAFVIFGAIVSAVTPATPSQDNTATPVPTQPAAQQDSQPTQAPTSTPQSIHYPPTTVADLRGLAAQGDASAIHELHSEVVGAVGACPESRREVLVDPSVTGQQFAEDLLAYFYSTPGLVNPCGSLVLAYHNQSEADSGPFTAGRIDWTVTDSSGQANLDPNATNLTDTLTLDVGGIDAGQEYTITY